MSYQLERRDGEWHVVGDDGSSEGIHASRTDAIKHQRRLYAQDSRVASMYAELDAQPDAPVVSPVTVSEPKSELVRIEIGKDSEALTASMMAQMERMSERQAATDQALVAALSAIGQREPVVNVSPAAITVESPAITVEQPSITVEAPTVNVDAPQITVQPADVNLTLPERSKTVTFERDPLTHEVTRAEVVET